jgi:hypothetical protein
MDIGISMRKLTACVLVALFAGALLVACGSSNKSTSQTTTTSGQAPGTSSTSASTSTGATPGTSSNAAPPNTGSAPGKSPPGRSIPTAPAPAPTPKQQLTACMQEVRGLAGISPSVRTKLEQACQKAGTSQAGQRKVVQEVCEAIAARLPSGASRERALNICRHAV